MSILVRIKKTDYANDINESKFYSLEGNAPKGESCGDCGAKTIGGVTPPHCLGCDCCYVNKYQLLQCEVIEVRSTLKNPFTNLLERYAFESGVYAGKSEEYVSIYKNFENVFNKFKKFSENFREDRSYSDYENSLPDKNEFEEFEKNYKVIFKAIKPFLKADYICKNEKDNIYDNLTRSLSCNAGYKDIYNKIEKEKEIEKQASKAKGGIGDDF